MLFESVDKRVVLAHGAKCGSRTGLMWCLLTQNPTLYDEHREWFYPKNWRPGPYPELRKRLEHVRVTGNAGAFELRPLPKVNHPIRVCVTRDPVERFISGFRNRVLKHKVVDVEDIGAFIDKFDAHYKNSDIYTHFQPQWHFYGLRRSWFTHILDLSEMHVLKGLIDETLPDLHLHATDAQGVPSVAVNECQRQWIMRRYAVDYALWRR